MRISEDNDLAGVGGIGKDFLVAGKRSIENDFAKTFAWSAVPAPPKNTSVL
jgi:hypothetical protein